MSKLEKILNILEDFESYQEDDILNSVEASLSSLGWRKAQYPNKSYESFYYKIPRENVESVEHIIKNQGNRFTERTFQKLSDLISDYRYVYYTKIKGLYWIGVAKLENNQGYLTLLPPSYVESFIYSDEALKAPKRTYQLVYSKDELV